MFSDMIAFLSDGAIRDRDWQPLSALLARAEHGLLARLLTGAVGQCKIFQALCVGPCQGNAELPSTWFLVRGLPHEFMARVPIRTKASWASPIPSLLATAIGRIEFVILSTGRLSPVALHLASRQRSYLRLSKSGLTPSEDLPS